MLALTYRGKPFMAWFLSWQASLSVKAEASLFLANLLTKNLLGGFYEKKSKGDFCHLWKRR